jgi:hypothetical protein
MVAGAGELPLTDRQQIAELRIRTMIDPPVGSIAVSLPLSAPSF